LDENNFVAKIRDSESALRTVNYVCRLARDVIALHAHRTKIKKTSVAIVFPAILTNADADAARVFCIDANACRCIARQRALLARGSLRQHFLKRDAVFLISLVYSG
jgi:hypothetical protein